MPDQVRERRGTVFGSEDCEVRGRTDRSPSRPPRIAYAASFGSSLLDQSQESLVASPQFEPTIRQVTEFRRTIEGNIVDLRRVGKGGSGLD